MNALSWTGLVTIFCIFIAIYFDNKEKKKKKLKNKDSEPINKKEEIHSDSDNEKN